MKPLLPRTERLPDGTGVRLRLARPEDREEFVLGLEHFGDESRYQRFFTAMPHLPGYLLEQLVDVDESDRIAIVAELIEEEPGLPAGVAVARLMRDDRLPTRADLAFAVIDELQGHGIGHLLFRAAVDLAAELGIDTLTADVLPENRSMHHLIQAAAAETPSQLSEARIAGVDHFEIRIGVAHPGGQRGALSPTPR